MSLKRTLPLGPAPTPEPRDGPPAPALALGLPPLPVAREPLSWTPPSSEGDLDDGPGADGGPAAEAVVDSLPASPAAPFYPPLPRAYRPTQTSLQAPPSAPAPSPVAPAPSLPEAPSGRPLAGPRKTVLLLGQTASVEAPGASAGASASVDLQAGVRSLPPDAPAWMVSARALSEQLEGAIAQGDAAPFFQAAVGRAAAMFWLSKHGPAQVARVHHLLARADEALRSATVGDRSDVLRDCAMVLRRSLPSEVRARLAIEEVEKILATLRMMVDRRLGMATAVARVLGWPELPETWLLEAVEAALASKP